MNKKKKKKREQKKKTRTIRLKNNANGSTKKT